LNIPEKKITFDFARLKKSPFQIKSEFSYNSNLSARALELGLKKTNYIAWTVIPGKEFYDHVIEAKIRLNAFDGYGAAGIIFRIMNETSYYMAIVSNKGYFRLDVVKDSAPSPLIAWTEVSDFDGININLKIISRTDNHIFIVNEKWLGETIDDSILYGGIGFASVSYGENKEENDDRYTCIAYLDFLSIDTRAKKIEGELEKWTDDSVINADGRLRLAETFAVMGEASKALEQINKAWKRRDEAISSVATAYSEVRTRRELLLAARMSFSLKNYNEAEAFIDSILEFGTASNEGKIAYTEKLKILNELNRFAEIKEFVLKHQPKITKDIDYYTITARCHHELKEYMNSAEAWDKAFELNEDNAVYAANAANAHEFADNKNEALPRYIAAGKIFLNQDNRAEIEVIMPKLIELGVKNWEARTLAGKCAYSIEDYEKSAAEFAAANKLRNAIRLNRPLPDPAACYLWALVLNLKGKNKEAIRLLEKAVELAPDYGLFRFKLAEIKLKSGVQVPNLAKELKLALDNTESDPEGDMAAYAGNLLLKYGDKKNAAYFLEIAQAKKAADAGN